MSPLPPPAGARDEHPDELTLVGFCEGRLLPFEREAVEGHLADCRACRDLVGALESELESPAAPPSEAPPASRPIPGRRPIWPVLLAAAAVLVLAFSLFQREEGARDLGQVELALGGTREEVFGGLRDPGQPFAALFVGVRLERRAWVRLIAVDRGGAVHEMPLDPAGRLGAELEGAADHVFGPYPTSLEEGQELMAVLSLVTGEEVPWSAVEGLPWRGALDPASLERLAEALGAEVRLQRLP